MLLKLFHKIQREGKLPNLFYKASITLIGKLKKDITTIKEWKKEKKANFPHELK
jgi:hypothetical protein